jgi:hypothetical protein
MTSISLEAPTAPTGAGPAAARERKSAASRGQTRHLAGVQNIFALGYPAIAFVTGQKIVTDR